jgi:acyl-coenzyme A thioesterase PaaI-like protein
MTDAAATELMHAQVPLCATLGITADTFRPDEVVLSLDWAPTLCTGNDVLHGGIVMALADSAGGACAFLNLPEGQQEPRRSNPKRISSPRPAVAQSRRTATRCTSGSASSCSKPKSAATTASWPPKYYKPKRSCDQRAS